ncbi:MAG: hypothetical protein HN868_18935 [Gammaproteobacteria bacterium]|nr:hypothetical protein [Gammaproteobacteria bacterium]
MSNSTNDPNNMMQALGKKIQASTRAVRGNNKAGYDALLFLNTRYESFPVSIQQDSIISSNAKSVYNNLWIWAKTKQSGSLSTSLFPDYEWIMRATGISRGTLASCMTQLRLQRYITLHQKVRNENKQFVGNDYILNDEPISLADTLSLDKDFIPYVISQQKGLHRHQRVQGIANTAMKAIKNHIKTADDPFRPQTHIEKIETRQQANQIIQQRLYPEDVNPDLPEPKHYYGIPIDEYNAMISRVHKMNAEENIQVHKVNAAQTHIHKVNSGVNVEEKSQVHKVNSAQTLSKQAVHKVNADMNEEVNCCSSSSFNITTTTSNTEFTLKDNQPPEVLIFPEFEFPNETEIARLCIATLPKEHQQTMLDELAGRMADKNMEKVKNVVGYLKSLINLYEEGRFTFTSYSAQQAAFRDPHVKQHKKPDKNLKLSIRNLHSEIQHLDKLIQFQSDQGLKDDALIKQRDSKQNELSELTQQKQGSAMRTN